MNLPTLPIGVQSFPDVIEGGFLYVDKTKCVYDLVKYPKGVYFLSRPRRFGKSLLISVLDCVFKGKRDLFDGLWIADSDYDWPKHPVIKLDFSKVDASNPLKISEQIKLQLADIVKQYKVKIDPALQASNYLDELLRQLGHLGEKAVVLIDEYDSPISSNITNKDKAKSIRDAMRSFYVTIKAQDENIRFVLLTGVSKFAKVSVFSGLNNLNDISMDDKYSSILGYTQEELENYFSSYIEELAKAEGISKQEMLDKIKLWYNGYNFSEYSPHSVYNPFSTLLLFNHQKFKNYWFTSGTPTLLIDIIKDKGFGIGSKSNFSVGESAFFGYEVDNISIVPLLYQTGYLTIDSYDKEFSLYNLAFPNKEVRDSFCEALLQNYSNLGQGETEGYVISLVKHIRQGDLDGFFADMRVFFYNIPNTIQVSLEKYYQTIFFCILKLVGVYVEVEINTNIGRIDAVMETSDSIYVIEFKLNGTKEEALQQIKDKGYADKYQSSSKNVVLIGVEFDKDTRNISDDGWVIEEV